MKVGPGWRRRAGGRGGGGGRERHTVYKRDFKLSLPYDFDFLLTQHCTHFNTDGTVRFRVFHTFIIAMR